MERGAVRDIQLLMNDGLGTLNVVALGEITSAAKQLDVALVVAPAFGHGNDVVEFKIVFRSTVCALPSII